MVNVLFVDGNLSYYFTPVALSLEEYAEESGIPMDIRGVRTIQEARQYMRWTDVAFVDGDMAGRLSWNNSGYAFIGELKESNPTAQAFLHSGGDRIGVPKDCPYDGFIPKPSRVERFEEIISDYYMSVARQNSRKEDDVQDEKLAQIFGDPLD